MNFELLFISILLFIFDFGVFLLVYFALKKKYDVKEEKSKLKSYDKKTIKPLTDEQRAEIHKRGLITPEEKLKEIESFGLCAPGDAVGSAGWRCHMFECDCHKCLQDYVASKDEWEPFEFKVTNSVSGEEMDFFLQKLE